MLPFRHLYLHIPFCRHKCGYCDFNAYAGMDRLMPSYVDALLTEVARARARFEWGPVETVYLGGGTPSLLPADQMARLLDGIRGAFALAPEAEVSLEANPTSTDPERLGAWREGGVNRISLGVQGFDPRALAVLERRGDGAAAERAFAQARDAGFDNINLDLIFAVPFQSAESWRRTLERAALLEPEHLSCYALTFEPGTLLHRRREAGRVPEVESDLQWDQLDLAARELEERGYRRYEVSNWARPGFEARHNLAYWACRPVYGAGAGAHSYATDDERAWRWWNVARPREYIAAVAAGEPRDDGEELEPRQARAEALMMGLRVADGMVVPAGFESELRSLGEAGLIVSADGRVAPTRRGMDLHNQIALAVL